LELKIKTKLSFLCFVLIFTFAKILIIRQMEWIKETQVPKLMNRIFYNFETVLSKRVFWAAMAQIKKGFNVQKDIFEELWLDIPTSVLGDQNFTRLNKATDQLQGAKIPFINEKDEEFLKICPFPVVNYSKRSGVIRVKVEKEAYPYLAELSKGYFWLKLKSMMLLTSKHAQRWYELFSEKKDLGEWKNVELEQIRKIFMIGELEYKKNSDLLKYVVYEPIREINEKTELFVLYEPMYKQKRPIIGFDFSIKGQRAKGEAVMYEKIELAVNEFKQLDGRQKSDKILELQREYVFPPKILDDIMTSSSLLDAILETDAKIKSGKLKPITTKEQYMAGVIKKNRAKF